MAKLNIQSIAKVLVEKNELPQAEAEAFVAAIFDTIQSGIDKDKLVKVKGLGTFKVINVEARESINVNTGERLVIDSHDKISFTPDSMMKELVNKPFSSFETVVLNDGVEFEDMPTSTDEDETAAVAEEPVAPVAPVVEQPKEVVEEKPAEPVEEILEVVEEPVAPAQPVVAEETKDARVDELTKIVAEEAVEASTEADDSTSDKTNWWQLIVVAIVFAAIGFVAGMFTQKHLSTAEEAPAEPVVEATETEVSQEAVSTPADTLVVDSTKTAAQTEAPAEQEVKEEPAPKQTVQTEPEPDYMKYDAMDQRLKTGAYYIIGTESVVEAREGDNIARVSRRYLGEGMSCYVEVYNGMPASTQLKAGQKVKIPKIIMKKTLRQRLEKQKNNQ